MAYSSPVVYNDTIVGYFLDNLVALDINDGSEIWKRSLDGFEIGSGTFATPTVYNFTDFGMDVTLVFTPGGYSKAFTAIKLDDGTTWWTRNFIDHNFHFMTWGISVIVDCGGTPVVIYNDDDGDIYAVNAITGALYPGWVLIRSMSAVLFSGVLPPMGRPSISAPWVISRPAM
jgi:outer membrane protein assembly factor BamB